MKYSELTPEEINALCAEVMGWHSVDNAWVDGNGLLMYFDYAPTEDMNLCMGLVEKMRTERKLFLALANFTHIDKASFQADLDGTDEYYLGQADTPQEAIIKAVLLANNLVEEE